MGLTFIEGRVTGPTGKSTTVNFLIESGASYSLFGREDWQAIELTPTRSMIFTLADGTRIKRDISECLISLPQGEAHTPVIFGEEGDEPLLGVILGLTLNPFNRTLQQMRAMLA